MNRVRKSVNETMSADSDDRIPRVNLIATHPTRFDEVRSPKSLLEYQLANLLLLRVFQKKVR